MADPDNTYRAHEEIERVRRTRDAIAHFRDQVCFFECNSKLSQKNKENRKIWFWL